MVNDSGSKKALIIRHGAIGDAIMTSCVFPYLKRDGYDITYYGNPRAYEVLLHNPYISDWIMFQDGSIPIMELREHYEEMKKGFDKTVIYTGAIENKYLFSPDQTEHYASVEKRRGLVNKKNYYDVHIEDAGYVPFSPNAEIYFTDEEEAKGREWKKRRGNHFIILWALSGSGINKQYRYFEQVARTAMKAQKDILLYTVGDYATKLLTFKAPRVKNLMNTLPFREVMLLAKYSDLVIAPETGLAVAAGCFDVPKIIFLSHACEEQLTQYWKNAYPIKPPCDCSPCHLLHSYTKVWKEVCQLSDLGLPRCTEHDPTTVLNTMEEIYRRKKNV